MSANNTKTPVVPFVGMGCCSGYGSDCYPYTIVEVSKSGKSFVMQSDHAFVQEGDCFNPKLVSFAPNKNGSLVTVKLTKRGWKQGGIKGATVCLNHRAYHLDPHF